MTQRNPTTPKLALKGTLLGEAVSPFHNEFAWDLPTQNADGSWTPGAWASVKGLVRYRKNGIHVCGVDQIVFWYGHLKGRRMAVWVCEYDGHTHRGPNGFAARRVRLLRPWDGSKTL